MQTLVQDLRYAARTLLKKPGFTLIAVMTLALGIGASTSIFTVVDAALLRGLPYKSPDRLYHLWESTPQKEYNQREFSYPDYQDYQQNTVFEGLAGYTGGGAILSGRGEPETLAAPVATANFFSVLGVDPFIGQTFQASDDKPGAAKVTVLTYGLWQRKFGGDRGVVGQALTLNGEFSICHETRRSLVALSTHSEPIDAPLHARHQLDRPLETQRDCRAGAGGTECDCQPDRASIQRLTRRHGGFPDTTARAGCR
jgi:MacB-like periplasmic core domain